jgi:transcriptional regulator with XRE-family HTH domain
MTAPTDIDRYVGQKLREFREAKGWTVEELVNKTERPDNIRSSADATKYYEAMECYEKGHWYVSARQLYLLAQALGVSVDAFFPPKETT